ncbi:MAG: hypothetical protein GY755_04635, partial [Chloroflexi bacterium]|nr:hypothetical protein [Chloroflexota bacterium]
MQVKTIHLHITNKEKLTLTGKINDANPLSIAIGSTRGEVIGTHFNFGEFILQEGENTLEILAADRAGNTGSHTLTIRRDTAAPQLTVTSPANGIITTQPSVIVTGTVSDAEDHLYEVRINNKICLLSDTGDGTTKSFTLPVSLAEGSSVIRVEAADTAG